MKYEEALAAVNRAHESDALIEMMDRSVDSIGVRRTRLDDGSVRWVVLCEAPFFWHGAFPTFREALVALRERIEGGK